MSQSEDKENLISSKAEDQSAQTADKKGDEQLNKEAQTTEEQNVYKQVLEKLAIPQSQDIQENSGQEPPESRNPEKISDKSQTKTMVENIIKQDFLKIESLAKLGLINSQLEQNLKNQVLKRAFDMLVQTQKLKQTLPPAQNIEPQTKDEVFREFEKENPDFFAPAGRKEVLDYLKSENVSIGKDDIKKITSIVENIEKTAIDRYLKQSAYEKNLTNSNELAKQRLTANAQNSSFQDKNLARTFTREQIGKMSGAEFTKYEPMIMEQLKKGLIR